jgi:hypothetical protein
MEAACRKYRDASATSEPVPFGSLRVEAQSNDIFLKGKTGLRARFSHFAFGQLAGHVGAPAAYLRKLPATLAVQNLNQGLKDRGIREAQPGSGLHDARMLFHRTNGGDTAPMLYTRAVTTELYDRVWNADLIPGFRGLLKDGWRVPPARPSFKGDKSRVRIATEEDVLPNAGSFGLSVNVGDEIGPAGLYASDHDCFVFMVNTNRVVKAGDRALMRGTFVRNSEVGDGSLIFTYFLLDNVCGNHIVWGAQDVQEVRVRHVGTKTLENGLRKFRVQIAKYEDDSVSDLEAKIKKAMSFELGATKEEVIEALFKYARVKGLSPITKKRLTEAYKTAEENEDRYGNPRTPWAMVSGLTQNSQGAHADTRNEVDYAAGKVLEIAF